LSFVRGGGSGTVTTANSKEEEKKNLDGLRELYKGRDHMGPAKRRGRAQGETPRGGGKREVRATKIGGGVIKSAWEGGYPWDSLLINYRRDESPSFERRLETRLEFYEGAAQLKKQTEERSVPRKAVRLKKEPSQKKKKMCKYDTCRNRESPPEGRLRLSGKKSGAERKERGHAFLATHDKVVRRTKNLPSCAGHGEKGESQRSDKGDELYAKRP